MGSASKGSELELPWTDDHADRGEGRLLKNMMPRIGVDVRCDGCMHSTWMENSETFKQGLGSSLWGKFACILACMHASGSDDTWDVKHLQRPSYVDPSFLLVSRAIDVSFLSFAKTINK